MLNSRAQVYLGSFLKCVVLFSGAVCCLHAPAQDHKAGDLTLEPFPMQAMGKPVEAESGRLFVPENRAKPNGKLIELAFVRLRSTAERPGPPVVYLVGGPGASGIFIGRAIRLRLMLQMRDAGDVILLDQRGVGLSKPNLNYEENWSIPLDRPASREDYLAAAKSLARQCVDRFTAQGVDLACYNTNESADDVDDLRRALGVEEISLCASSYGTHLSFAVIRRHPESVHRAILTGVEGPGDTLKLPSDIQRQLEKIDALCKRDAALSKTVPGFLDLLSKVLSDLKEHPVTVQIKHPKNGDMVSIVIGDYDLAVYVAEMCGRVHTLQNLPAALYAMSQGNFETLAQASFGYRTAGVDSAMSLVMDCASGVTPERYLRIKKESTTCLLGDAINAPYPDICEACGDVDLGAAFRAPVTSKVPVLFISGSLDGRTPESNALEAMKGFPNGLSLLVENVGHEERLFSGVDEMRTRMIQFLKGESIPTAPLDAGAVKFKAPEGK